jgi:polysaccharide pyruvyl transferase WcaK-like protein
MVTNMVDLHNIDKLKLLGGDALGDCQIDSAFLFIIQNAREMELTKCNTCGTILPMTLHHPQLQTDNESIVENGNCILQVQANERQKINSTGPLDGRDVVV